MSSLGESLTAWLLYGGLLSALWSLHALRRRRRHARAKAQLEAATEAGLTEPVSLHPLVDKSRCLGCGACVRACPEQDVLGLVRGKAELVNPSECIGHGACREACPFDAIELVIGTPTRGVDVPLLSPSFETSVPGIFVAGELGGMGLIRNAIEQGRQAALAIAKRPRRGSCDYDLVIVGAGPAGLSAALAAREHGLRFVALEQETLGGTVSHYPRRKLVMTRPVELPGVGRIELRETTKEELLLLWTRAADAKRLPIRCGEAVRNVVAAPGGFSVETAQGTYRTHHVLLAIGRRGTPRKLGVPGEDATHVVYRLIEPEQYRAQRVVVVGGGDSAVEAALALSAERGTQVLLSYRGDAFQRVKRDNRARLAEAERARSVRVALRSRVVEIHRDRVGLELANGEKESVRSDAVVICAGGVLPTDFLKRLGVAVETRYGTH